MRNFGRLDFARFKEAFAFARSEMGKTSSGAEHFALEAANRMTKR